MGQNPNAPEFEDALTDLQEHLPLWWRTRDPTSNLYLVLEMLGEQLDGLAELWTQPYLDQDLLTASVDGLRRNFAFAWGLLGENLPNVLSQLEAYIQARIAEDGTLPSFINTLSALINLPLTQGGPLVTLPATFPANGSGLTLYQYTTLPDPVLIFPLDGSGLTFPADGTGLTLGTFALVNVIADYPNSQLTVQVLNYLSFDRGAFARAVARFQPADWRRTLIEEVSNF